MVGIAYRFFINRKIFLPDGPIIIEIFFVFSVMDRGGMVFKIFAFGDIGFELTADFS